MIRTCAPDAVVACHKSGAIARRGDMDYPFLSPCKDSPIRVPFGTVEFLLQALEIDRECARGELPMLDPN